LTLAVTRCRVCGSEQFRPQFREGSHEVRRCVACGFVWVSPRLEDAELQALYDSERYWRSDSPRTVGYGDYRGDARLYLRTFRRRLDRALRGGPHGGRALDVGCGAGYCLEVLAERGFDAYGVEVSETIAREAKARVGAGRVHAGTLETSPHSPESFDLVTMWDVVEHVVDPRALLERTRRLLRPDGLLVLETQNVDSLFARLLGRRWHHYKHDEHLSHFAPATLSRLLQETGLRVDTLTPRFAGKYVSGEFIGERSGRVHPALTRVLQPLGRVGRRRGLYVNLMDEILVLARPVV
jgi:2-polyprenyl-3-methyl-5-hydroxy-6-metoxy-1,4-benzoquinol methylase